MINFNDTGRTGSKPELRDVGTDYEVATVSICVGNGKFGKGKGEMWVRLNFWGNKDNDKNQAQTAAKIIQKGDILKVSGRLMEPNAYFSDKLDKCVAGHEIHVVEFDIMRTGNTGEDNASDEDEIPM